MNNHPENNGHKLITSHSEDVIKEAEKITRIAKLKYLAARVGKGAFLMTASYGMTPAMYAELQDKEK